MDQTYYHGSAAELEPGDVLEGRSYFTTDLLIATEIAADRAANGEGGDGHVYQVVPEGAYRTDLEYDGDSFVSDEPVRVIRRMTVTWTGKGYEVA